MKDSKETIANEAPIFQRAYEFYKSLAHYHSKIPKSQRYTLWQTCSLESLAFLKGLIEIRYIPYQDRFTKLMQLSMNLDTLKVLIRLACDTLSIDKKVYIELQEMLQIIGKMLGGWIKTIKPKPR